MARSIDDYLNRAYAHKSDLDQPAVVTIQSVTDEVMQDGSRKPAVHFNGDIKPLLANITNLKAIARIAGTSLLDDWKGTQIELYNDRNVEFRGEVGAIRVRAPAEQKKPSQSVGQQVDFEDDELPEFIR
jgi:hypothetical protein